MSDKNTECPEYDRWFYTARSPDKDMPYGTHLIYQVCDGDKKKFEIAESIMRTAFIAGMNTRPAKAKVNKGKGDELGKLVEAKTWFSKRMSYEKGYLGPMNTIFKILDASIYALSPPAPCVDVEQLKREVSVLNPYTGEAKTIMGGWANAIIDHLAASGYLSSPQVSREKELMATIADAALSILTGANGSILDTVWYSDCETLYDFLRFSLPDPEGDWSNDPETQAEQLRAIIAQAQAQKGGE